MNEPILETLRHGPSGGLALCWLGNLSWLVAGEGRLIAFDLDLDSDLRQQPAPVSAAELAPVLDLLLITHEHGDHFNAATVGTLMAHSACRFVLPASCEAKAWQIGMPMDRMRIVRPRMDVTEWEIPVETVRALHGDRHQAVYRHANLEDCGYLLTLAGRRLFQPGDSVLLQDHLELENIDLLFVSPTDHNMHVQPAATLIEALAPSYIFPQHFGTYEERPNNLFWTRGYPDELRAALPEALQARYHKLSQGQVFKID
jgi:L-ascorbate metabolism protein UlaG (beta-lactamase superfamily)